MDVQAHSLLLQHSFQQLTGLPLLAVPPHQLQQALYEAPFALVSHNTLPDPVFNYANQTAQQLWEMHWDDFTQLPSRFSAEPISQTERNALLQQAREKGLITGYKGIRISKTGKRFYIIDAVLWNITNEQGIYCGQAAMFEKWEWI